MTVFKYYFKIIKANLPIIILYTAIATIISVIIATTGSETNTFTADKPNAAIINRDEDSSLVNSLIEYISDNTEIKSLEDEENAINDAIFFQDVSLIIIIPEGFTDSYDTQEIMQLEILKSNTTSSMYAEMLINRYMMMIDVYSNLGMNSEEAVINIANDLSNSSTITVRSETSSQVDNAKYYFNFLNYSLLTICITLIGTMMNTFHRGMVKKRNMISSTSPSKINNQLLLGNACFVLALWIMFIIISFIIFPSAMLSINGLLYALNLFIFAIIALVISFIVGTYVKGNEAISGVSNILGLGTSFICGAFVPQSLLGEGVLTFAKIFPSYWFVENNDSIVNVGNLDWSSIQPIILNYGILFCYIIGLLLINFIISKVLEKRKIN